LWCRRPNVRRSLVILCRLSRRRDLSGDNPFDHRGHEADDERGDHDTRVRLHQHRNNAEDPDRTGQPERNGKRWRHVVHSRDFRTALTRAPACGVAATSSGKRNFLVMKWKRGICV